MQAQDVAQRPTRVRTAERRMRRPDSPRRVAAEALKHGILTLMVLSIVLPLLWVLLLSVKSLPDAYTNRILPQYGVELTHYLYAWNTISSLPRNLANSVLVTLATVALTTFCAVLGGYALVHLRTPGKALVLGMLVSSLFFPVRITGLIGIWEIQRYLGLLNTTWGLVLPYVTLTLALSVFIMRGIFETIPAELAQAARVDGAGPWTTLWYVMLPLARNGIIVVALVTFVVAWGEYLLAATLTSDVEVRTLPLVLASATGGMGQWAWPRIAAVYMTAVVPAFVIFGLTQKRYLEGLQEGAFKN